MASPDFDGSGLKLPTSLEELETQFEPCGGFLRRKNTTVKRPSCILDAAMVVKLVRQFQTEPRYELLDSRG